MSARCAIGPLVKTHCRADFAWGNARIDSAVRQTVSQDVKCKCAPCSVAQENATEQVVGVHTLSSGYAMQAHPTRPVRPEEAPDTWLE